MLLTALALLPGGRGAFCAPSDRSLQTVAEGLRPVERPSPSNLPVARDDRGAGQGLDLPPAVSGPGLLDADGRVLADRMLAVLAEGGESLFFRLTPELALLPVYKDGSMADARVTVRKDAREGATARVMGDTWLVDAGQDMVVLPPGVLSNDHHPNGEPMTVRLVQPPAHGRLTLNPDGSFSYRAEAGYAGTDSFRYVAGDGAVESSAATVPLTILGLRPVGTGKVPRAGPSLGREEG